MLLANPLAALIPAIELSEAEDHGSHDPEIVASLHEAEADLRRGRTISLKTYERRRNLETSGSRNSV